MRDFILTPDSYIFIHGTRGNPVQSFLMISARYPTLGNTGRPYKVISYSVPYVLLHDPITEETFVIDERLFEIAAASSEYVDAYLARTPVSTPVLPDSEATNPRTLGPTQLPPPKARPPYPPYQIDEQGWDDEDDPEIQPP